jgi:serine/threonine-protein kinase
MQHAMTHGQRVPTDIALRVLADALTGLHAAHELRDGSVHGARSLGIVHRDFTPQNILVGSDGVSRLTDFGVAKAATRVGATRTGVVKGKTAYMAPEQVRAQPLDRRCDVWSAGVIAWELFAGRRLREMGSDPAALLLRIATEPAPRLSTVKPDIPPAVDEAVAWALAHGRERRCATAEQFRDRLLGAWADRTSPAEASDVAEHVQVVAGRVLAERRALALSGPRRQPSMIPNPGSGVAVGVGFGDDAVDEELSRLASTDRSGGAAATEASLVSSARQSPVRPRRRRWVLALEAAIVGGAVGVLALGARRVTGLGTTATEPAPSSVPDIASASVASSDVPASSEAPVPSAPSASRAPSRPPPGRRATPRTTHPKEAGTGEPPLAKSPYE